MNNNDLINRIKEMEWNLKAGNKEAARIKEVFQRFQVLPDNFCVEWWIDKEQLDDKWFNVQNFWLH